SHSAARSNPRRTAPGRQRLPDPERLSVAAVQMPIGSVVGLGKFAGGDRMRLKYLMAFCAAAFIAAGSAEAAGDAKAGQQVFARCAMCHSAEKGGANLIGPGLFGVVGRKAGTVPNYSYSAAMKSAGFTWTDEKLDGCVKSPATVVPGNKMAFAGLPSA